jgi:hypothetical protein
LSIGLGLCRPIVSLATIPSAKQRIEIYRTLMLIWWVVRWQRYLYEVPRGLDERLVQRPPAWLITAQTNYQRYLNLAQQAINQWR